MTIRRAELPYPFWRRALSLATGTVFLVCLSLVALSIQSRPQSNASTSVDINRVRAMQANQARWRRELQQGGGSWTAWYQHLLPFRRDIERQLKALPKHVEGLAGRDGFLFYRQSLEYVTFGDPRRLTKNRDPFSAIVDYNRQLKAAGIDMLLVIIPAKEEIYPEKISSSLPDTRAVIVAPYTRKLLLDLSRAGVESVDLLPAFLKNRDTFSEAFYMMQDTHWSNNAVQLAATLIAKRIKEYSWFSRVGGDAQRYTTRSRKITQLGDTVGLLAEAERAQQKLETISLRQVLTSRGEPYVDDPKSAVVILGDSFAQAFMPQNANLSAHVAHEIGMPVCLYAGAMRGPAIRRDLTSPRAPDIRTRKLVIWTVAARFLTHSPTSWARLPIS